MLGEGHAFARQGFDVGSLNEWVSELFERVATPLVDHNQ
jgi:hypothetical protein